MLLAPECSQGCINLNSIFSWKLLVPVSREITSINKLSRKISDLIEADSIFDQFGNKNSKTELSVQNVINKYIQALRSTSFPFGIKLFHRQCFCAKKKLCYFVVIA